MKIKIFIQLCCCVLAVLCAGARAFADIPTILPGQDIDAQAERFRQEYANEKRMMKVDQIKPASIVSETVQPKVQGLKKFKLNEIRIEGMDSIDVERLKKIWQDKIGQDVDLNDLQSIADQIKGIYKEVGYLTTIAYVPPQDIKDGIVTIRVAEGKIGKVIVTDNHWFGESRIRRYIDPYKGKRLNVERISQDMMRLNENPDINVSAVLSPGKEPETSDITLKVKERVPYHVNVGFDNQGSRLVGRYRTHYSFNSTNLSGRFDQLFINTTTTKSSFGQYVAYRLPVGSQGFKVGMDVGFFNLKLGEELKSFDVTGTTKIFDPNIGWEMKRTMQTVVTGRAGLKIKDVEKKVGRAKTTNDRLRIPYFALDYAHTDATGQTTLTPEISIGTSEFLGATGRNNPIASRPESNGVFIKYEQSVKRMQRMPFDSYAQIRADGQLATHTLPSSEQMQLGGARSVRGYPEGDYLADHGVVFNADWVFPMYVIPSEWKLKWSDTNLRHQIEPAIFMDMGAGRLKQTTSSEIKNKFLMSTGVGLRIHMNKNLYVRLDWADPIGEKPVRGTGPSVFSVSMQAGI